MGVNIKCEKCPECGMVVTYDEYAYEDAKRKGFLCRSCEEKRAEDQMEP